jgi:ketosteroid isomerase-like protein
VVAIAPKMAGGRQLHEIVKVLLGTPLAKILIPFLNDAEHTLRRNPERVGEVDETDEWWERSMTGRHEIDGLIRELYAARSQGDLDGVCAIFADDAQWRIAGASHGSPVAVLAQGGNQIRSWLTLMMKTFQISDLQILSTIIDETAVAAHWRAVVRSRITGAVAATEFIDLAQVRDGRIVSYTEFFAPC